jgi:anhydro-N-acetylmuramic acid kinase
MAKTLNTSSSVSTLHAPISALGLMSGTSMDGVDVALIRTDGEGVVEAGPSCFRPYLEDERTVLREALKASANLQDRSARPDVLRDAERVVTHAHIEAIEDFASKHGALMRDVSVVGFHGQTVLHRPDAGLTVQIGDAQALADSVHRSVVADFRAADVAAGGEGAPLVPVYHRALVQSLGLALPAAVLNVGGVANFTYVGEDGALIACDTGPGNALMDDLMLHERGLPMDKGGELALAGHADFVRVKSWLASHPYFARALPKSLDRQAFAGLDLSGLSLEDALATLAAFTAGAVARACEQLPRRPKVWVVCGGGAYNLALMAELERVLGARVLTADALGWDGAALEAQAFGYLAVRSMRGLPLTYPLTTGAAMPMGGGVLAQPREALGASLIKKIRL